MNVSQVFTQASAAQGLSDDGPDGGGGGGSVAARGHVEGLRQGRQHHEQGDEGQYDGGLPPLGQVGPETAGRAIQRLATAQTSTTRNPTASRSRYTA